MSILFNFILCIFNIVQHYFQPLYVTGNRSSLHVLPPSSNVFSICHPLSFIRCSPGEAGNGKLCDAVWDHRCDSAIGGPALNEHVWPVRLQGKLHWHTVPHVNYKMTFEMGITIWIYSSIIYPLWWLIHYEIQVWKITSAAFFDWFTTNHVTEEPFLHLLIPLLFVLMVAVRLLQGAGVEIYPGSVCSLVGNGVHHCKEGILIKVSKMDELLLF